MGKTVTRAAEAVATGGLSEFTHGTDAFGLKTGLQAVGLAGKGYTPTMLSPGDPKLELAQSGGAPLLTQIALGASVEDAVAGYFGRSKGQDYDAWYKGLNDNDRAAIDSVTNQLNQIQSNTQLRDQAVQQVVKDYPNLVQQLGPQVAKAKQDAGEEFDAASKQYLDYAMSQTAAKYAAGNQISSGATIAAEGRNAAELGMERLNYTTDAGNKEFERGSNDLLGAWTARYTEANALRGFQQKMLGQGATQGFSAAQSALQRAQQTGEFNANVTNQKGMADQAADNALLGTMGSLAGTAAIYGAMGSTAKTSTSAPKPSTAVSTGNDAGSGYRV